MTQLSSEEKIDKIYNRLVGDEDLKTKGLIDQVDENTSNIKNINKRVNRTKWISLGAGIGAGAGSSKLMAILAKIFSFI